MRDRQPEYTSHQPASIGIYVADRADDAADLREDLRRRAEQSGQALSVTINPSLWPAADMDPYATIMVVVGYTDMIADSVWAAVERCRSRQIPVLVTYDPRLRYEDQSPKQLRGVNGHRWPVGSSPDRVTRTLTRMVGIDVSHRRIFLSYRRGQGERIAHQLRHVLIDAGWRVFLDSFNIEPGAQFQQELFRDLDARSLVLVIESRGTRESAWVDDEIAFATAHGIGIRALVLPGGGEAIRFPAAARIAVRPEDLVEADATDPSLRDEALESILTSLQIANTAGFRLRTEDMMLNASGFLLDESLAVSRLTENVIVGSTPTTADVVLAIGRRPQPTDIRILADAVDAVATRGRSTRGWLVHRLTDPDPDYVDLISWIAATRGVEVVNLMGLPAALRAAREKMR